MFKDIVLSTLHTDSPFFALLGDDKNKIAFFKAFIAMMRKEEPDFGKGCYVDSTPLPNDINDNPFNALCCHGVGSSEVMTRLALVLDGKSGLPVWYDIIPGNILDLNEFKTVIEDVASTLGVDRTRRFTGSSRMSSREANISLCAKTIRTLVRKRR